MAPLIRVIQALRQLRLRRASQCRVHADSCKPVSATGANAERGDSSDDGSGGDGWLSSVSGIDFGLTLGWRTDRALIPISFLVVFLDQRNDPGVEQVLLLQR